MPQSKTGLAAAACAVTALTTMAVAAGSAERAQAQAEVHSPRPAVFNAAQAQRGEGAYMQNCALCHGDDLLHGESAPPLKGDPFTQSWGGKTAGALFVYLMQTMPPTNPGLLGPQGYADVTAYLLQANGARAGDKALPADEKTTALVGTLIAK